MDCMYIAPLSNQLVRSNWGLGVLLRDTSTRPGWDRTGDPPTARRLLLPPEPYRPFIICTHKLCITAQPVQFIVREEAWDGPLAAVQYTVQFVCESWHEGVGQERERGKAVCCDSMADGCLTESIEMRLIQSSTTWEHWAGSTMLF